MISAVILAAGESSRMGRAKALLRYRGKFFIEVVRSALAGAGVERIVAVLGRHAGEIRKSWKPEGVVFAVNPRPEDGQLSSVRAGLENINPRAEAAMICLVDQPAIAARTYKDIIAFWSEHKDSIIIPRIKRSAPLSQVASHRSQDTSHKSQVTSHKPEADRPPVTDYRLPATGYRFKRGHPIIIPRAYFRLCFEGPLEKGLHWVTHHPSVKVLDLDVQDENIVRDVDTPEDYRIYR